MLYQKFSQKARIGFIVLMTALAVFIIVKSLTPSFADPSLSQLDKLAHIAAYLVLGLVCLPAFPRFNPVVISALLVVFGIGIEMLQGAMNTGRVPSLFDGFANAIGAFLALGIWVALSRVFR